MPITSVTNDKKELTLTVIADFPVSLPRLWDAYMDPRQIEKFWGPVEYPATFWRHDAYEDGLSHYRMVGPEGDTSCGYWQWLSVKEHQSFEVLDGFSDETGTPNHDMPTMRMVFDFIATTLGSRLTTTTHFPSLDALEQLLDMGMEEGMTSAMSQIDAVVQDSASFAVNAYSQLQELGDEQARISRIIQAPMDDVWRSHTDPAWLKRWQLGPEGWSMPLCIMVPEVGHEVRSGWQNDETSERFGFVGEVKEVKVPRRLVTTERFVTPDDTEGDASAETINELTLRSCQGGTLLTYVITYPSSEIRHQVLETGMVDGMEASFARLETQLAS